MNGHFVAQVQRPCPCRLSHAYQRGAKADLLEALNKLTPILPRHQLVILGLFIRWRVFWWVEVASVGGVFWLSLLLTVVAAIHLPIDYIA